MSVVDRKAKNAAVALFSSLDFPESAHSEEPPVSYTHLTLPTILRV